MTGRLTFGSSIAAPPKGSSTRLQALRVAFPPALSSALVIALSAVSNDPALATPLPGARLASCVLIEDPSTYDAEGGKSKVDPDDDDEEDDDEEDDEEDETKGVLAADGVTCVAVGGSVTASAQGTRQSPKNPSSASAAYSSTAVMGLKLATSTPTEYGVLTTSFDALFDTSGQHTLNTAILALGSWSLGYDSSQFSYWTGEDFAGSTLQPMPSSFQLARKFKIGGDLTFSVSLESPVSQPVRGGAGGSALPTDASSSDSDKAPPAGVVLALEREGDVASGKIAFYGRTSWTDGTGAQRPSAWAASAGMEYDAQAFISDLTITTQATISSNAPELIGTRFERATIRNLNLPAFETLGVSGVVAVGKALTDQWSLNAYASFFNFSLPSQPLISGRVFSIRGAANLTWSPTDDFNLILEVNLSRLRLDLSGPAGARGASGTGATASLTLTREF
jgi:hypothetical protein